MIAGMTVFKRYHKQPAEVSQFKKTTFHISSEVGTLFVPLLT